MGFALRWHCASATRDSPLRSPVDMSGFDLPTSSARCSLPALHEPQPAGVNYCTSEDGRQQPGCSRYRQSSYSHHDAQECCIAGTDRNYSGHRSSSVDVRQYCPQCPAWVGSSGNPVPVVHLCVCLPQRGGVLLCVPPQSAIVIVAYPPPLRLASSPEYRLCGRSLRTAMPNAFFCPITTSSRTCRSHRHDVTILRLPCLLNARRTAPPGRDPVPSPAYGPKPSPPTANLRNGTSCATR